MTGTVKWFDKKRGWGFIAVDEQYNQKRNKSDIFVHFTTIQMQGYRELAEGQRVEFNIGLDPKGHEMAENVVVIT